MPAMAIGEDEVGEFVVSPGFITYHIGKGRRWRMFAAVVMPGSMAPVKTGVDG